ncbi:MAG: hypothetical protein NVS3B20_17200 [Polyangiales bacterium]
MALDSDAVLTAALLHEATHNFGPTVSYKHPSNRSDADVFGGDLSSMLEELKAQTGSMYWLDYLQKKGVITEGAARKSYAYDVSWAFMWTTAKMRDGQSLSAYPVLSVIQLGALIDAGAVTFEPDTASADGKTHGAFAILR